MMKISRQGSFASGRGMIAEVIMYLVDEVLDHLLGHVDVGDHAVAQRPNGLDLIGGLAHHQLGVVADRLDLLDPVDGFNGDY